MVNEIENALDYARFLSYLSKNNPNEIAGFVADCYDCPIAQYLKCQVKEIQGITVSVTAIASADEEIFGRWENPELGIKQMPYWVVEFIRSIDKLTKNEVTFFEAIAILESITP